MLIIAGIEINPGPRGAFGTTPRGELQADRAPDQDSLLAHPTAERFYSDPAVLARSGPFRVGARRASIDYCLQDGAATELLNDLPADAPDQTSARGGAAHQFVQRASADELSAPIP